MRVTISSQYSGMLLREYLRNVLGISRAMLTKLKNDENGILLNGSHVTVRALLSENDVLTLKLEDTDEDENPFLEAVKLPFEILFEDENIIVVSKPAFMPTHTTHGHYDDTLANALYSKFKGEGRAFVFRAVNRLDRDTSGAVLVAKDRLSAYKLSLTLQRGEIEKKYIAVLCGKLSGSGVIKGYIKRCGESIITRTVCEADENGAEYAETVYRVLASNGEYSIVEAVPVTGRTHQLRVHFSSLGHPIVGDELYGTRSELIERQALHSFSLTFKHPMTEELIACTAALPNDILRLCEKIGLHCEE